ncbi:MAG: hypothetical protein NDI61_04175 [Bdellovibrionaceae bacterium]|nr:hypothetical protein [Pseudobdellovibrionaceae bacterium]
MELVYQVAAPDELDELLEFTKQRLADTEPDPIARRFAEWTAPWRRESLEHYLKLGWSFTARVPSQGERRGELMGFFLGQPFLFLRGHTQTLWIEHLDGLDPGIRAGLTDVAVRLARDKHMQRVLFGNGLAGAANGADLKSWPSRAITEEIREVQTTKG